MAKDYLITFLSTGSAGQQYANTICVHDDELGGPRGVEDVVDDVDAWLTTAYRGCLKPNATLDVLRCFRIPAVYGDDSDVTAKVKGLAGTGNAGDGKLPREATLTLSLRSSHTSRRSQGRISIPSPEDSAAVNSSGQWDTGTNYWAKCGALGDALLAGHDVGLLGVDGHLSTRIYSRKNHITGDDDKTTDISSYIRRSRPRWLRRRVSIP